MGQFNPSSPDSDGDNTADTDEDPDNDGWNNKDEYRNLTDPTWSLSNPTTVGLTSRSSSRDAGDETGSKGPEQIPIRWSVQAPVYTYQEPAVDAFQGLKDYNAWYSTKQAVVTGGSKPS